MTKNRSYRRFKQQPAVDAAALTYMVECARLAATSANMQPLKFFLSNDPRTNNIIFPQLAWAGYLVDWPGPAENERPTGYVIVLGDKSIKSNFGCDHGIISQTIMLAAVEKGFGGCMIASVKKEALQEALKLPEQFEILLVLALGTPAEEVVIEPLPEDGSIRYWRDDKGVHHVPKRDLKDLIVGSH